ncbi:MAG: sulfatase/phosphatase domain-containing protein, partial [Cyclobacteriaceae bacterium]
PATATDQYLIVEDFFPTILEMARVRNYKTVQNVDGKTFVPVLKNPVSKNSERFLIWHFPNKWQPDGPGINYKSAIRQGDWKLIYHMRTAQLELFNLKEDIGESTDVSKKYPDKVKVLSSALSSQLKKWAAAMPVTKSTNKTVPFSDEL